MLSIEKILETQVGDCGKLSRIRLERLSDAEIAFVKEKTAFLDEGASLPERLYVLRNNLKEEDTICPVCNNKNLRFFFIH